MNSATRVAAFVLILGGASSAVVPATAADAADYFKGKTITYIINTPPGGGHDYYARLMARHMERQIPGVTIINKNVGGAGGLIATNEMYKAKPDGLTIGTFSTGMTYTQIVGAKGMRFDMNKMSWIGKQATDTRVIFMSSASPFKTWDQVAKADMVKFGTSGVGSGSFNESYMVAEAWKLKMKLLPGYSGNDQMVAMLRGDFDGRVGGLSSQLDVMDADPGKIVIQFGDEAPDVLQAETVAKTPLQKAVNNMMSAQGQLYRLVAGPPGIPVERLKVLRDAFRNALTSDGYRAEADKSKRPYDKVPMPPEKVGKLISDTIDAPPEMVDLLKGIIEKGKKK